MDGQEYHPFNWNDKYEHLSHNTYHMLAMGIDSDAYTAEYTRSLFSDEEIDDYLKNCVDYVHRHNGAICATHPNVDYWSKYDIDAVDKEPMAPLSGTDIEKYWLSGKKLALMVSVDLFGFRRVFDNPSVNFIYLGDEEPCRDSVVKAVKNGHTIAATGFSEADITMDEYLPGDEIPAEDASKGELSISARIMRGEIKKVRVYSGANLIYSEDVNSESVDMKVSLAGLPLEKFVRVEVEGMNKHWICNSTPFYIK
ncbi:MAG: hypothetical protein WCX81_04410 [Monoglobales bacterium]